MKAIVCDRTVRVDLAYPDPRPQPGECLVRVHLAGICATDLEIIKGYMGFRGVLGHEMVGTVVQGSPDWRGKRVAAEINCVCTRCEMCLAGLANHCRKRTVLGIAGRDGCFAEIFAVPERNLHLIPPSITDEEAVFVEPLAAACQVRAQCPLDARTRAVVVGTGKLGVLIAQVLHGTGCRLTAVGRNRGKLLVCEKLGIQTAHVADFVPRADADVVVECTGAPEGIELAMRIVRPRGTIVLKSTYAATASPNLAPVVINEVTVLGSRCGPFCEAIIALQRKDVEVRTLISRVFPLEQFECALDAAKNPENLKVLLKIG